MLLPLVFIKWKELLYMGDYIKKDDTIIKISGGQYTNLRYSRKELLLLQIEGFKGYYVDSYNNELEDILNNPTTIYGYDNLIGSGTYSSLADTLFVIPNKEAKAHDIVNIWHNGYHYEEVCKEMNNEFIKAKLVGERFINGKLESIFACNCCRSLFTIDHLVAMYYRNLYPLYPIYSLEDREVEDLSLIETLELMIMYYSYSNFMRLLNIESNLTEIESVLKTYGYPTVYYFYNQTVKNMVLNKLIVMKASNIFYNDVNLLNKISHLVRVYSLRDMLKFLHDNNVDENTVNKFLKYNGYENLQELKYSE